MSSDEELIRALETRLDRKLEAVDAVQIGVRAYCGVYEADESGNVVALGLDYMELSELPAEVFEFEELDVLSAKHNNIREIPASLKNLYYMEDLDLSYNQLEILSPEITSLSNLEILDLGGNNLTELPAAIGELVNLQILELDFCKFLKHLPVEIGQLVNLIRLRLGFCDTLSGLPASIERLTNLQVLDLQRTSLTSLPDSIGGLVNLRKLNLSETSLKSLPDSFGQLVKLQEFIMTEAPLLSLPDSFGQLENLQRLNLTQTDLSSLPEGIGRLKNLQKLYLGNTNLTILPEGFGALENLQRLTLRRTELRRLPENFGQLESLEELSLSMTKLESLPDSFGLLKNLVELNLRGLKLKRLPENFGQLESLKEIKLTQSELESLPESFGKLTGLRDLDLSFCDELTGLPESFGQLANLERLNLSRTPLARLPESIGQLTNLQELWLAKTKLTQLPEGIGNCVNLEELNLRETKLRNLPPGIGRLTNLKKLDLNSCEQLTSLPASIGRLTNLKELDLSSCEQLTSLSDSIVELVGLETLILRGTALEQLPAEIGKLTTLQELELRDTPLQVLPDSIKQLDTCRVRIGYQYYAGDETTPHKAKRNPELEARLHENPQNPDAWVAYGDWLQKENDPRGKMILQAQAAELFQTNKREWLGSILWAGSGPDGANNERLQIQWKNGFMHRVRIKNDAAEPKAALFNNPPIDVLLKGLLDNPSSLFLDELRIIHPDLHTDEEAELYSLYSDCFDLLKAKVLLPSLRRLQLGESDSPNIDPFGHARDLLSVFPNLESLKLYNFFDTFSADHHQRLKTLLMERKMYIYRGDAMLAQADFPELETLCLREVNEESHYDLKGKELAPLFNNQKLPKLKHLSLQNFPGADEIARELFDSPLPSRLVTLELTHGGLSDAGAQILLDNADLLGRLKKLDLSDNTLGEDILAKLRVRFRERVIC